MAEPRLISVTEWRKRFVPSPTPNTVWRWIKAGKIQPAPIKYGRSYYLEETAVYAESPEDADGVADPAAVAG